MAPAVRQEPRIPPEVGTTSMKGPSDLNSYLGGLTVTQGRLSGYPFHVLPWQCRFVRGAFAPGVQSAALSVGRGNGKTALLSGIACATLDGPLMVPRGETVIVASSFEQARIAFEHVLAFLGDKLADKGRWKVWDTAQQARVEDRRTGARVRCIGSDPRRAHGLAPVLTLADEPAQWPPATGERMVAALRTAAGKQPHSRFVALGTRPADGEHWFAKMLAGGADYAQCHAARPDDPKWRKRTWERGQSFPAAHARPRGGDSDGNRRSQGRPFPAGGLRCVATEPRHGRYGSIRVARCRHLGTHRGRRATGRAGRVGYRPRHVGRTVGRCRVLAGDRSPGMSGGLPDRTGSSGARLTGWRRGGCMSIAPAGVNC